jgi:hypothetical protein
MRGRFLAIALIFLGGLTRGWAADDAPKPSNPLKKDLKIRFTLSQLTFSNWAKGGENTFAYTSNLIGGLGRDFDGFTWKLHGDFAFGQSMLGKEEIRNTLDRIQLDANITWKNKKYLNPYCSFSLRTQFARGYDYKKKPPVAKSDFWDPAYILQSAGLGYQFDDAVTTKFGFAIKHTFTRNFRKYSDDPRTKDVLETYRMELGVRSRVDLKTAINSHLKVASFVEFFSDLSNFRGVDMRWENRVTAKLAKYISVNLELFLLYDRDVTEKMQIRQFTGIGVNYSFF